MKTAKLLTTPYIVAEYAAIISLSFCGMGAVNAQQPPPFTTAVQPYAVSNSPDYMVKAIISAGDRVPHTSDPSNPLKQYQMIGVPDEIGRASCRERGSNRAGAEDVREQ